MSIIIRNIRMPLSHDIDEIKKAAEALIGVSAGSYKDFYIVKQSIDARRKGKIEFVYSISMDFDCNELELVNKQSSIDISYLKNNEETPISYGNKKMTCRPIIIGTGPSGLFAALSLARHGYAPLVLERGEDIDKRTATVNSFWNSGNFDASSNVQFGEGGAGTFSDGKLTTRINDKRCRKVFEDFVAFGAPNEILWSSKPHIGTDNLKSVVKNIRNEIISLGGEVRFNSKVTEIDIKNSKIKSVTVNDNEAIKAEAVVAAIGHSARDTYEMLYASGLSFTQKPFSIGVRIEHLQKNIDIAQFGEFAEHPQLKSADYQLVYKNKDRACYSFCMCPGGIVVASQSEENTIVTNGMSEYARNGKNANSALAVNVECRDFESNHPLAGIEFQRKIERLAFVVGGSSYAAPVQNVGDFISGIKSTHLKSVFPSYTGKFQLSDLHSCLPKFVSSTISETILNFENKIKGFSDKNAVLTGVETRTSSPVRILRNEDGCAGGVNGFYPAGEGSGYAGGIISSAVDGIKAAEKIMQTYKPLAYFGSP